MAKQYEYKGSCGACSYTTPVTKTKLEAQRKVHEHAKKRHKATGGKPSDVKGIAMREKM